jgi:nucleotide-binding universal stress UspA family protein
MSITGSALDLRLKSVLMATDLSPASVKPLHHALAIARYYGAKLYVAHVVSPIPYLMAGPEALQLGCAGAFQDMQQLQRDLLHDGSLDGLDHEFIIRHGSVWEELQAIIFQKQVDLVVVGTHGRRGTEKVLLGSVAEQVFRDATCPVLTVGPYSYRESRVDLTGEIRTYLFATDFGETSRRALPQAVSLASQTNAGLSLLHVVPAALVPQIPGWYSASEIMLMRENARQACVRRLEQLMPREEGSSQAAFLVQLRFVSGKFRASQDWNHLPDPSDRRVHSTQAPDHSLGEESCQRDRDKAID